MDNAKSRTVSLVAISIATLMALSLAAAAARAGAGGHLWFYSVDPDTIGGGAPQPLPNPEDWDPKYVGTDPDPWMNEGIVVPDGDFSGSIWLGCSQFESLDTMLVVSINDIAYDNIEHIYVEGDEILATDWDTTGTPPVALAPHGVFNSAEFYGCAEIQLDPKDLHSPPGSPYKAEITVVVDLNGGPVDGMKIHFDAYGLTNTGQYVFSPYSHDSTFVVPEPAVVLATVASFAALGLYATRKKRALF